MLKFTSIGSTCCGRAVDVHRREILTSASRKDSKGFWQITTWIKNAKHVSVFIQQTCKMNALMQNPYFFDTFEFGGDNSAKLRTRRLQYGSNDFYPEIDYNESSR